MTSSGEVVTPKYADGNVLDSPMEEAPDPLASLNEAMGGHSSQPQLQGHQQSPDGRSDSMRPPPLPAHLQQPDSVKREPTTAAGTPITTPDEARRALDVVLSFFEQQPNGFLDLNESVTIGKLMEKLKLHPRSNSIS
jgi:hypothetical protein